jgi:hypothetical protein
MYQFAVARRGMRIYYTHPAPRYAPTGTAMSAVFCAESAHDPAHPALAMSNTTFTVFKEPARTALFLLLGPYAPLTGVASHGVQRPLN